MKNLTNGAFTYGSLAENDYFTNRVAERKKLSSLIQSNINTILISPRRWGKSSLVKQASSDISSEFSNYVFCFIDLFDVRSEIEFYEHLANEIIAKTSSKWEERLQKVQQFLGKVIPKISLSTDATQEFSLSFDRNEAKKNSSQILDLAEEIAKKQNLKIVICVDEFQNISYYDEPLAFQKKLRSHWQTHQHVTYCLYGSKRHMMMDVFTSSTMPFYKFGEVIFLEKIHEEDWIPYIQSRFIATGKLIDVESAAKIAQLVENHPHYVQQLAQQVWFRTDKNCTIQLVETAFKDMILQLNLFFQATADQLTSTQLNFLSAILDGVENYSSQEVLKKYRLGTSANIGRIKQALIQKEVLDFLTGSPLFLDPIFKAWLVRDYFKKQN